MLTEDWRLGESFFHELRPITIAFAGEAKKTINSRLLFRKKKRSKLGKRVP